MFSFKDYTPKAKIQLSQSLELTKWDTFTIFTMSFILIQFGICDVTSQ